MPPYSDGNLAKKAAKGKLLEAINPDSPKNKTHSRLKLIPIAQQRC